MTMMSSRNGDRLSAIALGTVATLAVGWISLIPKAYAHHPTGAELPATFFQGLLSGVGHPVIGLDHLAFVIALGAIAAFSKQGFIAIAAFLATGLLGTVLHLQSADLPLVEIAIAFSTLAFGILVVLRQSNLIAIATCAAIAGLFHGYAYGESIIGAEPTPFIAYLIGFTAIQAAIAFAARAYAKAVGERSGVGVGAPGAIVLGGIVTGVGLTFFAQSLGI
ncbi:MAG: HupE/UreJ family protein [Cyanobacteria bacterium J06639_1]